jgi:hypothetical protein
MHLFSSSFKHRAKPLRSSYIVWLTVFSLLVGTVLEPRSCRCLKNKEYAGQYFPCLFTQHAYQPVLCISVCTCCVWHQQSRGQTPRKIVNFRHERKCDEAYHYTRIDALGFRTHCCLLRSSFIFVSRTSIRQFLIHPSP